MRDGLKFKAWQPGGAGTDFLTEAHLDLPMEFESIGKAGSRLGTALAMAVTTKLAWFRWCVTWKSFSPVNPAAGVRLAVTVCRGA
jgi:NADH-quinone oxidoreductase subunit F